MFDKIGAVWWLVLSPHSKRVPDSHPGWGHFLFACSPTAMREFSLGTPASSHYPKTCIRLTGDSTLTVGVSVRVDCCLSCVAL